MAIRPPCCFLEGFDLVVQGWAITTDSVHAAPWVSHVAEVARECLEASRGPICPRSMSAEQGAAVSGAKLHDRSSWHLMLGCPSLAAAQSSPTPFHHGHKWLEGSQSDRASPPVLANRLLMGPDGKGNRGREGARVASVDSSEISHGSVEARFQLAHRMLPWP